MSHPPADHPVNRSRQFFKRALKLPFAVVIEDGVVGREVFREHSTLTACFDDIHDGIHKVAERIFSLPVFGIQNNFGNLPPFISKVSWILLYDRIELIVIKSWKCLSQSFDF